MIPMPTRDATTDFHKPDSWEEIKDGRCGVLSVRVEEIGRRKHHISTWKPTDEELGRLVKGALIELRCVGIQPPVALAVTDAMLFTTSAPDDNVS